MFSLARNLQSLVYVIANEVPITASGPFMVHNRLKANLLLRSDKPQNGRSKDLPAFFIPAKHSQYPFSAEKKMVSAAKGVYNRSHLSDRRRA